MASVGKLWLSRFVVVREYILSIPSCYFANIFFPNISLT